MENQFARQKQLPQALRQRSVGAPLLPAKQKPHLGKSLRNAKTLPLRSRGNLLAEPPKMRKKRRWRPAQPAMMLETTRPLNLFQDISKLARMIGVHPNLRQALGTNTFRLWTPSRRTIRENCGRICCGHSRTRTVTSIATKQSWKRATSLARNAYVLSFCIPPPFLFTMAELTNECLVSSKN